MHTRQCFRETQSHNYLQCRCFGNHVAIMGESTPAVTLGQPEWESSRSMGPWGQDQWMGGWMELWSNPPCWKDSITAVLPALTSEGLSENSVVSLQLLTIKLPDTKTQHMFWGRIMSQPVFHCSRAIHLQCKVRRYNALRSMQQN